MVRWNTDTTFLGFYFEVKQILTIIVVTSSGIWSNVLINETSVRIILQAELLEGTTNCLKV